MKKWIDNDISSSLWIIIYTPQTIHKISKSLKTNEIIGSLILDPWHIFDAELRIPLTELIYFDPLIKTCQNMVLLYNYNFPWSIKKYFQMVLNGLRLPTLFHVSLFWFFQSNV